MSNYAQDIPKPDSPLPRKDSVRCLHFADPDRVREYTKLFRGVVYNVCEECHDRLTREQRTKWAPLP